MKNKLYVLPDVIGNHIETIATNKLIEISQLMQAQLTKNSIVPLKDNFNIWL